MDAIRRAGIPAPKVISYSEHPETPWAPVSILMTRIPGHELSEVYEDLEETERESTVSELKLILETMRSWPNPGDGRICSIYGGPIRSIRVLNHRIGPHETERESNEFLLSTASSHSFRLPEEFDSTVATAKRMEDMPHSIIFMHGDFAMRNVLVARRPRVSLH
ncbi:hypothetical protein DL765_002955 [Monosporascus sp. GIB2]|nr:hypothetical protein DL765_002955 [Monosporascus sp. GIB2]